VDENEKESMNGFCFALAIHADTYTGEKGRGLEDSQGDRDRAVGLFSMKRGTLSR
jgi:hypothetical protein